MFKKIALRKLCSPELLGGSPTKNLFTKKCLSDHYKKLLSFNMLFGADTKMPDGAGKEKVPLTQYARRD